MATTEHPGSGSDSEPIPSSDEPDSPESTDPAEPTGPKEPTAVYASSRTGLPKLGPYFRGVNRLTPFMWYQARSDLKAENYNTALGQMWLILNPLLLAGVFILGRSVIRPLGDPEARDFLIAHLVGGIFFYQYVAGGWSSGSRSLTKNKALIDCTSFPRMVFPFTAAIQALLEFIPLLGALFLTRAWLNQPFGWSLLALIPVIFLLGTFTLGLALGSATILVYFRDFTNVISLITRLWLWATPILYTSDEIPPQVRPYLEMNPLYPSYVAMEQIFAGDWPSLGYLAWAAAWSVVSVLVGGYLFLSREREFAVRL